jgi:hypothetical protein
MSKGHGKVQKALLRRLRDYEASGRSAVGVSTQALVKCVYGARFWFTTKAQKKAVRRALHGLAQQGLIVGLSIGGER